MFFMEENVKLISLLAILLSVGVQAQTLDYGPFRKYFELGQVDFYRSTGFYQERESDYEVIVHNKYPFAICLIPELIVVRNGRDEYTQANYIIEANSSTNLGHYGALEFGRSWHMKWEYFVSQDLYHCED
jgi:hypothetical protein